jgi:hypothetical protein
MTEIRASRRKIERDEAAIAACEQRIAALEAWLTDNCMAPNYGATVSELNAEYIRLDRLTTPHNVVRQWEDAYNLMC